MVSGGQKLTIVPIDWYGKEKTVKVQKGTDKDGKPKMVSVPKEVQAPSVVCVVASVEGLEKLHHEVADALKDVKALVKSGGLFSKKTKLLEGGSPNEIAELQEEHAKLTRGCEVSTRRCAASAQRANVEKHALENFQRAATEAASKWQIDVGEIAEKKYRSNQNHKYNYFAPQSVGLSLIHI